MDENGDGEVDVVIQYGYDELRRLARIQRTRRDAQVAYWIDWFGYNEIGKLTTWTTDTNGDSRIDSSTGYEYNPDGRLITDAFDSDADGTPDRILRYEYDVDGALRRTLNDTDADGEANIMDDLFWEDRLLRRTETYSLRNHIRTTHYFYDVARRRIREEMNTDADPEPEIIWRYHYDERGLPSRTERARGILDYEMTFKFDSRSRLIELMVNDIDSGLSELSQYDISCSGVVAVAVPVLQSLLEKGLWEPPFDFIGSSRGDPLTTIWMKRIRGDW